MELMCFNELPLIAAFFIGLMTAISPCPLTTNITAVAFISKKFSNNKHTLLVSFVYTLGRAITYILVASLIVLLGINVQAISLTLQQYGDKILGPLLIIIGLVMLDLLKFRFKSDFFNSLKNSLGNKGLLGGFLLGALFALAFCPFSAVMYFGLLIPLALSAGDSLIIPSMFALGTSLPVIIFSLILSVSVSKLSKVMNQVKLIELWTRRLVAVTFIVIGIYCLVSSFY
jgi:cytochrome c biogenesis protein CcdA